MITIDRTRATAPAALVSSGKDDLTRIEQFVKAGALQSKHFKKSIYGSDSVRDALWEMQHHKCCFCEQQYERKFSTVEHFRPKTSARSDAGQVDIGYWWLAYEFENLYFCCSNCNTPKSDWFPLESGPRYKHPDVPWALKSEASLILDPGSTATIPDKHLRFVRHPKHKRWRIAALDQYGKWTIRAARLDRDDLNELRDTYYEVHLEPIVQAAIQGLDKWDLAQQIARVHCAPRAPFSLLARSVYSEAKLVSFVVPK
jgi:uncharacterized protein (TIGR02646 family)